MSLSYHIVLVFLRGQTEKDSTNMCSHGKIHFVLIFCFLLFHDGTVDQHFRYVISNKVCPYFLFDILWLVRMVVAQANRIFQFAERGFNGPPPAVEDLEPFRREFFPWEIRHNTFVGIISDGESGDTEGKGIGVKRAIFDKIKSGFLVNETSVSSGGTGIFLEWLRVRVTVMSISKDSVSGKWKFPTKPLEWISFVRKRKYCPCCATCAMLL